MNWQGKNSSLSFLPHFLTRDYAVKKNKKISKRNNVTILSKSASSFTYDFIIFFIESFYTNFKGKERMEGGGGLKQKILKGIDLI